MGRPLGFVEALGGIGYDMYVLRWEDSTWTSVDNLGYGTKSGVQPVPSPEETYHLLWAGQEEIKAERLESYLITGQLVADTLTQPDTITTIYAGSLMYAAAASPVRRWASAGDFGDLRVLYSDAPGAWIEIPVPGRGDRGVAVAALDDTSALVAWRDRFLGPGAGILRGANWMDIAPPPMTGLLDAAPRFRLRPSGGHWLSWATEKDFIGIASNHNGIWTAAESVFCAYLRPEPHRAQSRAEMSRDGGEYPAVSWMAVSAVNGLTSVCVCVPDSTGFPMAENLLGSEEGISPVVARDRNEDVWVAWMAPSGMAWVHTYTQATSSPPIITGPAHERLVAWTLSEPAPGSWWAVLRSEHSEPLEEVARLRAGEGPAMSWIDLGPSESTLRYRIRRECMDKQYEWLSDETLWPVDVPPTVPLGRVLVLTRASSNPADAVVRFELLNASAGLLDVQLYDLRGRLLLRQRPTATGSGRDSITINLVAAVPEVSPGLYFLRVGDSSDRMSASTKVVFLR